MTIAQTTDAAKQARRAMIDSQLRTSGVNAPFVLRRMGEVAREDFVPKAAKSTAYMDRAITLANGRALPAPLVQGRMLSEAALRGNEQAIVVDGGSGYLAELLRPLVGELTVLSPAEAVSAGKQGQGAELLLIDGAVEAIPGTLAARLADGALVVTGLAEHGVTRLAVGRKSGERIALQPVADMGIPQIAEFDTPKGWSF